MAEPNPDYNKETSASWQEDYRSMIALPEGGRVVLMSGEVVSYKAQWLSNPNLCVQ
jgi:hypothetical protein